MMTATMRDDDKSWLEGFAKNYKEERAEAERKRWAKERENAAHWARVRENQREMDVKYAPKLESVQRNLQWWADEKPVSNSRWEKIRRRSALPSFGPEMSTARMEAEAEAEAPIDQGILGLGILSSIRKIFQQELEQSDKKLEAERLRSRPHIF